MFKRGCAVLLAAAAGLLATAGPARLPSYDGGSIVASAGTLRPGQFLWAPDAAPAGPMLVVIDIATQRLVAYRGGVPIAASTVSTGKPGHRTPTGVFTILQKAVHHRSNLYSNAPMPYMQRLTWQGVALHGGSLPGYPASHGCIRLPHAFASLLFKETRLGMTVVVVNQAAEPRAGKPRQAEPAYWRPGLATDGPVSVIVSAADRRMVVLRGGVQIGSAPVAYDGVIDRAQAYVLQDGAQGWARIALPGDRAGVAGTTAAAPAHHTIGIDPFRTALADVIAPGTTMLVVPDSLAEGIGALPTPASLSDEDIVIAQWLADGGVTGGR